MNISEKFGSFFQDIKELWGNFSWESLNSFCREHWVETIILLLIFVLIFYFVSKLFEFFVKLAIASFLVWLIFVAVKKVV